MTTLVGSFTVLLILLIVPAGLFILAGRRRRRWEESIARQISLTDAIHRELGAIAAPTVSKGPGRRWDISIPVALDRPELTAALVGLTERMFPSSDGTIRIVLTRADHGRVLPIRGPRAGERRSAPSASQAA